MANLIRFSQGKRYQETTEYCPSCGVSHLYLDKMSANCTLFVCLHCNYNEEREEPKNEVVSDYHVST